MISTAPPLWRPCHTEYSNSARSTAAPRSLSFGLLSRANSLTAWSNSRSRAFAHEGEQYTGRRPCSGEANQPRHTTHRTRRCRATRAARSCSGEQNPASRPSCLAHSVTTDAQSPRPQTTES
ncbi:hypothetical protein BJF83_13135 [Nocardiopsis sp. CNR-923]|nr:hypothetical protein BJF83_13135 [Nocardiopsis sp. CNR-923]